MNRPFTNEHQSVYGAATGKLKRRTRRIPILFIGMFLNILTISLIALAFSPLLTKLPSLQAKHIQRSNQAVTVSPSRTPSPTQQPAEPPLPPTLKAQIAALEAHNRFFYHGNSGLPEIALTFDDGPNPTYTPQILAILKTYHIQATFFTIGSLVQRYPQLARQEIADGHVVGNHSWSHPDLSRLSPDNIQAQLQKTSDIIAQTTGRRPVFFRPPYGNVSANVLTVANRLGLSTVIWNDEARDWTLPGTSVIVARILNLAGNGSIILLHDGGGNRSQTVAALPIIIEQLMASHYTFVTIAAIAAHLPLSRA